MLLRLRLLVLVLVLLLPGLLLWLRLRLLVLLSLLTWALASCRADDAPRATVVTCCEASGCCWQPLLLVRLVRQLRPRWRHVCLFPQICKQLHPAFCSGSGDGQGRAQP